MLMVVLHAVQLVTVAILAGIAIGRADQADQAVREHSELSAGWIEVLGARQVRMMAVQDSILQELRDFRTEWVHRPGETR